MMMDLLQPVSTQMVHVAQVSQSEVFTVDVLTKLNSKYLDRNPKNTRSQHVKFHTQESGPSQLVSRFILSKSLSRSCFPRKVVLKFSCNLIWSLLVEGKLDLREEGVNER